MDSIRTDRLAVNLNGTASRRAALRGLGGAGLAAALLAAGDQPGRSAAGATAPTVADAPVEPNAGSWKTWLLASGDQFRPAAPPDETATETELDELQALATERDAAALDHIAYWNAGAPAYRWNNLTIQHLLGNGVVGLRAARALALLNVAICDATIAAWDAKYAYNRPRPAAARPALATALPTPASPAYPSEHAVAAGAAAAVLGSLFPAAAATFAALAEEAGHSRLLAGTDYPSDVATGMDLGRRVAELAIARAEIDGSDATWTGSVPDEPGKWNGTKPYEPLGGTWQTWVLESGDQFRPGPPPAYDSAQMATDLAELKEFERTNLTNLTASYWEYYGGRASFELYTNQLSQKLFEERLDDNPPRAARAYALMDVALYDVFVACWDAKYAYWAIRPFQLDPTVTTVFVTPNHPSYPAAHASLGGAMETILGALFPRDTDYFTGMADDESWSRLWAGIHFRADIEAGRALGRGIGQAVVERARQDGAD
ncbi:MAG TPA: phosphatase PAP2 family protein [Thermomicrobiales bacterium]|jgi:membrane-associated phospholipid phosphatase